MMDMTVFAEWAKALNAELDVPTGPTLPQLSIRGSKFHVQLDDREVPLLDERGNTRPAVDVVIIAAASGVSKFYYDRPYDGTADISPRCRSRDGVRPDSDVINPVSEECATCPMNAWGSSGEGRRAKACRDYKLVIVAFAHDLGCQEFGRPLLLRVPPTSLKALHLYVQQLQAMRPPMPYCGVVTELSFEPQAQFPQLRFRFVRPLRGDELKFVARWREDEDVALALPKAPAALALPKAAPSPVDEKPSAAGVQPAAAQQRLEPEVKTEMRQMDAGQAKMPASAPDMPAPSWQDEGTDGSDGDPFDLASIFGD